MEVDVDFDDDSLIWVDDDWKIFLPDDESPCVVIEFDDLMNPHAAADIAMRFTKILDLAGVRVMVATEYKNMYSKCDSSSVAEFEAVGG